MLSKSDILNANDLLYEDVDVPEWNGVVRVRCLTGKERDKLTAAHTANKATSLVNFMARFAVLVCCDENMKPLFDESDLEALGSKNACVLDRIMTVGMRLSALTNTDIEDMVKN